MRSYHNVEIFDYKRIWSAIKDTHVKMIEQEKKMRKKKRKGKGIERIKYLEFWKPHLESLVEITAIKLKLVYIRAP